MNIQNPATTCFFDLTRLAAPLCMHARFTAFLCRRKPHKKRIFTKTKKQLRNINKISAGTRQKGISPNLFVSTIKSTSELVKKGAFPKVAVTLPKSIFQLVKNTGKNIILPKRNKINSRTQKNKKANSNAKFTSLDVRGSLCSWFVAVGFGLGPRYAWMKFPL